MRGRKAPCTFSFYRLLRSLGVGVFGTLVGMAPTPITEDYYTILGVDQTAGLDLIVRSYKRLALKLHPDRNADLNATEAFQRVCQTRG